MRNKRKRENRKLTKTNRLLDGQFCWEWMRYQFDQFYVDLWPVGVNLTEKSTPTDRWSLLCWGMPGRGLIIFVRNKRKRENRKLTKTNWLRWSVLLGMDAVAIWPILCRLMIGWSRFNYRLQLIVDHSYAEVCPVEG